VVKLLGIERGFVDQAPVDRADHLDARADIDIHAAQAGDVDLLRLGLVHGAQLRERIGLLVLHRDAGLLREGLKKRGGNSLPPGAPIGEIGDGRLGGLRRARRDRDQRRQQHRSGRGLGQHAQKIAPPEAAGLLQHGPQPRAGLVGAGIAIARIEHGYPCPLSAGC
jgi:hypothetical protein